MLEHIRVNEIVKKQGGVRQFGSPLTITMNVEEFSKHYKECINFIFHEYSEEQISLPQLDENVLLDLPFKICNFEILKESPESLESMANIISKDMEVINIMVIEKSPRDYMVIATIVRVDKKNMQGFVDEAIVVSVDMQNLVQETLKYLHSSNLEAGIEKVRQKVKLGTGKNKEFHTIRKLVHIKPKNKPCSPSLGHRVIDWSHRWNVRGHWREIIGIGKDREGNYLISGMTWVKNCVKGPKDLPIIKKDYVTEPY